MIFQHTIWNHMLKFRSSKYSQTYLKTCYELNGEKDYEALAFQNTYPFIYYLEHAEKYFSQVSLAPIEIRPVLLFYGMIQLMKACLLLKDPYYPESSQVLAHGVTTRKRKKNQYLFLDDEVKLQKNGLLPHFSSRMFHVKQFSGEKYKMRLLLRQIPEMHSLFTQLERNKPPYKIQVVGQDLKIPCAILDDYQFGPSSFCSYLSERSYQKLSLVNSEKDNWVTLKSNSYFNIFRCHPFLFDSNGNYYLSPYKNDLLDIPELMAHYLILYNLSMICRYETEWWGDLFHHYPEYDYPFILQFLTVTVEKVPLLLFSLINKFNLSDGRDSELNNM